MQLKTSNKNTDKIGLILVLMSSVLLGIWATMHTIALRNILLGFGSLLSFWIWKNWLQESKGHLRNMSPYPLAWSPLVLTSAMLCWVAIHFLYFSTDPQRQWEELTSTWLRALLAVLIGSATGLVLIRKTSYLPLLWAGLLISFVVLIGQYIPKALHRHSIFGVDFFADYIYWAKFSGVLAGTALIAGLLGLLVDHFRVQMYLKAPSSNELSRKKSNFFIPLYVLSGIFIATYSFVFIFDAKAGVGMAVILISFWILVGVVILGMKFFDGENKKNALGSHLKLASVFILISLLLGFLAFQHAKNNPAWNNLIGDVVVSAQINKHQNWRNSEKFGMPLRDDGVPVSNTIYGRVAWATVGLSLIANQPLGTGITRSFVNQVQILEPGFNEIAYTHSGWVDLGLSFGIPGLLIIPAALLIAMMRAVSGLSGYHKATIITLSLSILILYMVGEYAFQHGIEILFYFCGLLGGLSLVPRGDQKILI